MKLSNLFFVFIFLPFFMLGQIQITGTIVDENNQPIPADIYTPESGRGTIANFDGEFQLDRIPNGNHEIIFSYLGYSSTSKRIRFPREADNQLLIILKFSSVEMDPVILSIPFHQLQKDNVMKVEQIRISDLQKSGAVNLSDGISNMSGVNTINTGVGIGKPVIRGLSSNRVLTYSQDVRLENQQFGEEHGLGINESGIESVEVIKGPASLLYGSDALGGVLYLNPERFAPSNETQADLSSTYFTNTLGTSTNLGVKTSGNKFRFLARGAYSSFSDYKTGGGYRVTNSRFNEKDLKTGVQYLGTSFKSILRYNYNRSDIGIADEIGEQTHSKKLELPFQEIDNHILSMENTFFLKNSSLDVKAGFLYNDRREFEEELSSPELQMKLRSINYDIKYHLPKMAKLETIIGVQGMFQSNKNEGEEILIPDATTRDFGIMATSHYHLEKVDLQAGVRFDSRKISSEAGRETTDSNYISALDKTFNSFTAAVGAKVDFTREFSVRLNLASGFRAPNLAELTSHGVHEGTYRYEIGNANLTTEQNLQTDLSFEYRNEHIELFANGFYNAVNNFIFLSPTNEVLQGNNVYEYQQNDAALYGGEFGFHLHPHPLDWIHFESSFETVTGRLENDAYLPLIPAHSLRNTFRINIADGQLRKDSSFFVTLQNTFDQTSHSEFETRTGGYSLLSAGIESKFNFENIDLAIGITGTNLTDKEYVSHLSRFKPEGILNIGRSVNLSLKLEI